MKRQYKEENPFESYLELLSDHYEASQEMAGILENIQSFQRRAMRMRKCQSMTVGQYCEVCKTFHAMHGSRCRDRLCPNCGWALSRERAKALYRTLSEMLAERPKIAILHVVLTLQHDNINDTETLEEATEHIITAYQTLTHYKAVKRHLLGHVRNVEICNEKGGLHPHIHALWLMDETYWGDMINQDELCHYWGRALKVEYKPITYIRKVYRKGTIKDGDPIKEAIYEAVKYNIKTTDWAAMSLQTLASAAAAVANKRFFQIAGRELSTRFHQAMGESVSMQEEKKTCERCGSRCSKVVITFDSMHVPEVTLQG